MEPRSDSFLPLICDYVPEHYRSKAEKELQETSKNVENGLQKLREFLKNESYPPNEDDNFLLQFLRQQKFNIRKAETKLKQYYVMREKASELYESMDSKTFRAILDSKVIGLLPFRDIQGRAIIFTIGVFVDFKTFSAHDLYKCALALFHFAHSFPLTSICGMNLLGEATLHVADALSIFNEGRKFIWIEKSCPFRIQRIDYYNELSLFRYLWNGMSIFLPSKYTKRLFFHGSSTESIASIYDPSILREELGGVMEPLKTESYIEPFLEYVKKLKAETDLYRKQPQ